MLTRHFFFPAIILSVLFVPSVLTLAKDQSEAHPTKKEAAEQLKAAKDGTRKTPIILEGKVVEIIDGETLLVLVDKTKHQVRLMETKQSKQDKPPAEKAKKALADKFLNKMVQVTCIGMNDQGPIFGTVKLSKSDQPKSYWLTSSTNTRHNNNCRYYQKSKGQSCGPNDGKPCKICGG
jgi:hypothetical protein